MEKPSEISSSKMFGGYNKRYKHYSSTLGCSMTFHIYFPPSPSQKIPVLYWLSGLTCTDENFIIKSGAQRAAAAQGIALVAPDTSPRGLNVEGEADSWDFGVGMQRCATHIHNNVSATILIDQGDDDKFLHEQLLPHKFEEACRNANVPLLLRLQPGYDHSYFFISTFIDDHIRHHAQALKL
ncbi:PREDICTED: S-formylglutathione hydrolase [Nelumbo nucifera]|uniref:S-formylglutathione hydrolase n=1 Tax=Nelumbo nucifera TaxID=4432 RepID=A0A1U8AQ76_NELNU|nr:PREDICTED: S-formylglutathione hydrolase [Nelumbo nucifera]